MGGRKAGTKAEDAIAVIEQFIEHFTTNQLPPYSSPTWVSMSKEIQKRGGTWNSHSFYTAVRENRREILTKARVNQGIILESKVTDISLNDSSKCDISLDPDSINDEDYEANAEAAGLHTFSVAITQEDWRTMRNAPENVTNVVTRSNLVRDTWELVVSDAISRQWHLPCAYAFDSANICESQNVAHYLRIKGHCLSKRCNNPLFAYAYKNPGDSDFILTVRTHDTSFVKDHENVSRPIRGGIRLGIGREVFHEGAYNWRNKRIGERVKLGGRIPATMPSLHVLNQCKKDYVEKELDVKPSDGKDLRKTILEMQDDPKYRPSILIFNPRPFYVIYNSVAQRYVWHRYREIVKKNSAAGVDGTGTITRRFERADGTKSGHIFSYLIIINFDGTSIPVHQMLTESQNTDTLTVYLKTWIRPPAPFTPLPKPLQFFCDGSRALLDASCLAFNDQKIRQYVDTLFMYATNHSDSQYRPHIDTYIRLDVAHLMKAISRWESLKTLTLRQVRIFYMYAVGLLINCQTIDGFQEILLNICTVGSHEFQDATVLSGETVKNAREILEKKIGRKDDQILDDMKTEKNVDSEKEEGNSDKNYHSHIREWVDGLLKKAQYIEKPGKELNPFYAPEFIQALIKLSYEFTLWTPVGLPFFIGRASTSYNEGYFHLWKHNELKNYGTSLRLDKLIKLQLQNTEDQTKVFSAKLANFTAQGNPLASPIQKENLTKIINHSQDSQKSSLQDEGLGDNEKRNDLNNTNQSIDQSEDSESEYYDNWRNKGIERKLKKVEMKFTVPEEKNEKKAECVKELKKEQKLGKREGRFVKPNPDIAHQNELLKNVERGVLLRNGNLSGPVVIKNQAYILYNTCHYDVLVQILMTMAIDRDDFKLLISQTDNETLKLIVDLVDIGLKPEMYQRRGKILKELFQERMKTDYQTPLRVISYSIDTINSCTNTWKACLPEEWNTSLVYHCEKCGVYSAEKNDVMSTDWGVINNYGFKALQNALPFTQGHRSTTCRSCTQPCTMTSILKCCLYIELDIRQPGATTGMECKLSDLPTKMSLEASYSLVGVVGFVPMQQHYIAYTRRANGRWQSYNDYDHDASYCEDSKKIIPHCVIYLRKDLTTILVPPTLRDMRSTPVNPVGVVDGEDEMFVEHDDESAAQDMLAPKVNGIESETPNCPDSNESRVTTPTIEESCSLEKDLPETPGSTLPKTIGAEKKSIENRVLIGTKYYEIQNSSSFDSIVQLLYATACDDYEYKQVIALSGNLTMTLVMMLTENGITEESNQRRVIVLRNYFHQYIYASRIQYTVKMTSCIFTAWEKCMTKQPSVIKTYECTECQPYSIIYAYLQAEHSKSNLCKFQNMEKVFDMYVKLYKVDCTKCSKPCTVSFSYSYQVYVKLLSMNQHLEYKKYKLNDIQTTLNLKYLYR